MDSLKEKLLEKIAMKTRDLWRLRNKARGPDPKIKNVVFTDDTPGGQMVPRYQPKLTSSWMQGLDTTTPALRLRLAKARNINRKTEYGDLLDPRTTQLKDKKLRFESIINKKKRLKELRGSGGSKSLIKSLEGDIREARKKIRASDAFIEKVSPFYYPEESAYKKIPKRYPVYPRPAGVIYSPEEMEQLMESMDPEALKQFKEHRAKAGEIQIANKPLRADSPEAFARGEKIPERLRKYMQGAILAHELAERSIPFNRILPAWSHHSPKVLFDESNLIESLTGRHADDIKSHYKKTRDLTGEDQDLRDIIRSFSGGRYNFKYGETKLPRAMKKRIVDWLLRQTELQGEG